MEEENIFEFINYNLDNNCKDFVLYSFLFKFIKNNTYKQIISNKILKIKEQKLLQKDIINNDNNILNTNFNEKTCAICLYNLTTGSNLYQFDCNHSFHYNCSKNLHKCPLCRN